MDNFEILIVDDDVEMALNLKDILQEEGYSSAIVKDGKTALALFHKKGFDLVVADIKLPDIPGLELTAKLAELSPGLECIIITGHTSLESAIKAVKRRDIIAYESKPLNMDHLLSLIREIAERRQAEQALRESEFKYRSLFENIPDGFAYCKILLDENNRPTDFVYLEVNDAFERLTGMRRENVVGKKATEAIPGIKESHPELFDIYGRVALTGKETEFDIYLRPLEIWLSISVYSPKKRYFIAVFENITERKRAEKALRSSEEKLRNVFRSSPDAITVTNLEGNITECNQATLEMHGFSSRKELIGKSAFDLIAPKEHQVALENIKKTLKEGFIKNVQYTLLTKDGTEFPAELSASVIRNSSGKAVSLVAITSDITLRKRMEETLRTERDRLHAVTQNIGVGLAVISKEHRILWANEILEQILGKVEGKVCYSICNQRTDPCPGCGLEDIVNSRRDRVVHEQETKDCNDNTTWLEIVSTPIKDKEGNITGALEVVVPITERKKAEQKIQAYAQELMVMNEQLRVETERAQQADRLKSEFLANMSHEIRTPLTAISGASHLLDKGFLSSEQRKLSDIITQSGKNLLKLINDILDLARIEAGQVKLEEKEFSLRETLKKLIPGFKLQAKEKGIELDLIYSDSLPLRIISDKGKLIQILSNLITNALKFTEKGKVEIRLESSTDSKIQVLVKDTGIGISKEKLPSIFNKFYQVDGTLRRKYQGTGLGLAIAKGLVKFLGGEIEVQSTLKKGSTFSFNFSYRPVEEKVEEIVLDKAQDKALFKVKQKLRGNINILIAEDDDFNYYVIDRFLKGCTVSRAKDGKEVLERIEKKRFDLVLMDIQMPEMDGLTATRKIREKNKDLPIIALTAKAMKKDKEKSLAAGCTDYISKPITPEELIAKVEQYTARRLVRGEESSTTKVLDIEALLKNSGKDKTLAKETLHMFVEYLPQQLSQIRKAITDDNFQDLERLCHSLKGAAKTVGVPLITEIASNLEKMAASGTIDQTEATFSHLAKEKERFQETAEKIPIS